MTRCAQAIESILTPTYTDNSTPTSTGALTPTSTDGPTLHQVCRDCGQQGDERLLSDLCHERKVEVERRIMNITLGKKSICSSCKEAWSRRLFGQWRFTGGPPCVRVRNPRDVQEGERMAEGKTAHSMEQVKHFKDQFQCLRGLD